VNTTPIRVPLVTAGLGALTIVGTIAGVLLTQKRSNRRERENGQRERESVNGGHAKTGSERVTVVESATGTPHRRLLMRPVEVEPEPAHPGV
jgi:hypothetical protein